MTKVVRFLASIDDPPLDVRATSSDRLVTLALDRLPRPRFAAVEIVRLDGPLPDDLRSTDVVVAEEVRRGDPSTDAPYRMVSVARRHPSLSRSEFADRWRAEAGNLGAEAIPDDVRGVAYVQDHPVGDDAPFDAVNEVWLATLDDLRRRAEWFAARPVPADLFDPAESFALYLLPASSEHRSA